VPLVVGKILGSVSAYINQDARLLLSYRCVIIVVRTSGLPVVGAELKFAWTTDYRHTTYSYACIDLQFHAPQGAILD